MCSGTCANGTRSQRTVEVAAGSAISNVGFSRSWKLRSENIASMQGSPINTGAGNGLKTREFSRVTLKTRIFTSVTKNEMSCTCSE